MAVITPSPEVDLNYCFSNNELNEQYKKFAAEHGYSTCSYDMGGNLAQFLNNEINTKHLKALEISPWNRPFLSGSGVKYFDAADSESLRKSAVAANRDPRRVPSKIDFISPNGDLNVVDETFDIVFSSHVIEHCPDLIRHFQSVSRILCAGGVYALIIPDKRYCFDYYNSESTISEVIDAFINERKMPRLADVINLAYTCTHNNAKLHWIGQHGERYGYRNAPGPDLRLEVMGEYFFDDISEANRKKLSYLIEKYNEALKNDKYISTHNWRFIPDSFGYIINLLNKLEFIDLTLYRLCHTIFGRQEFVAMLEKT